MKWKILLLIVCLITFNQTIFGQVTDAESELRKQNSDDMQGWKKGGVVAVNIGQTSLTNWAAGGENSFSVNGLFSLFANYKRNNVFWDNSLDIGYGLLKQGEDSDYMKTDDKFDYLSKYGRKATKNLYYAALVNFKTQMTEGKDYAADTSKISDIFSPAYILGAFGMDYKPNSNFSSFIAPVTGKITVVNNQDLADAGAFRVDPATFDSLGNVIEHGKKSKSEFGGYIRVIYTKNDFQPEILKNISLTSKIDLFSNYADEPQNIDVNWETQIAMSVNRFISFNINTHLIYDDNIMILDDGKSGPRTQFKEIFGAGFSYKF